MLLKKITILTLILYFTSLIFAGFVNNIIANLFAAIFMFAFFSCFALWSMLILNRTAIDDSDPNYRKMKYYSGLYIIVTLIIVGSLFYKVSFVSKSNTQTDVIEIFCVWVFISSQIFMLNFAAYLLTQKEKSLSIKAHGKCRTILHLLLLPFFMTKLANRIEKLQ